MSFRLLIVLTGLTLAGCGSAAVDLGSTTERETREHIHRLADQADKTADAIESGELQENAQAFDAFAAFAKSSHQTWDKRVATELKRRSPPKSKVNAEAWRELADGLRRAAP